MVVVERNLQGNQIHVRSMCVFSSFLQMFSDASWDFLLLFLLLLLSLGLDFVLSLSFQFSFHHQVNRQNRMCVSVFPSDDTLSSLIAALHQSCADLHGEQFQEILAKDRCDFKNQLLWSFVLRILFGFPLLFSSY